jgi:outer membrane receptor for ferrienterochelin and colicins
LRVDAHATWFTDRVVADLDADPGAVTVRQATGPARSYAAQAEVEHEILTGLDLRLAAKYEDVRVRTAGQLRRETFVPVWRGLAGLAWTSGNERWTASATLQLTGPSRLPLAYATERSEAFPLLLGQVSHKVGAWRVYVGTENALNYRQPDPIRGAEDPFGPAFDAAGVWGPILGRNVYAGVTVTLPR